MGGSGSNTRQEKGDREKREGTVTLGSGSPCWTLIKTTERSSVCVGCCAVRRALLMEAERVAQKGTILAGAG